MPTHAATARMIGSGNAAGREEHDFYATPPRTTLAVLPYLNLPARSSIWEPACGQGHISEVLELEGHNVISTDLIDRGYGTGGRDFLREKELLAPIIMSNPPFKIAAEFTEHGLSLKPDRLILLTKLQFLECKKRVNCIDRSYANFGLGLQHIYQFIDRQSLWKGGQPYTGGAMAFCWLVWKRNYSGPAQFQRIWGKRS